MIDDQARQDVDRIVEERRVDAAFEPRARIAGQRERLAGLRNTFRGEVRDFEQHVGRVVGDARMLTAHDAADVVDLIGVGDDGHLGRQCEGLAVERGHGFAVLRPPRDHGAGQARKVIGMARAAEIEHHEIGDVDQCGDRPLPDRLQLRAASSRVTCRSSRPKCCGRKRPGNRRDRRCGSRPRTALRPRLCPCRRDRRRSAASACRGPQLPGRVRCRARPCSPAGWA
jgi:hypothetical protein